MLMPKRVKYRRQHRGTMKGAAHKGNTVTYGEYGMQALRMRLDYQQTNRSSPYCYDPLY